ncbi:MAG TPA: tetratricopeptide repeat protein [Armatimonadota bacterium]|nr:tetratricopeptide repeat protein [Armatimonadota bacterium]
MRRYVLSLIFAVLFFMLCSSGFASDDTDLWDAACAKVDAGDLTDAATLLNQLLTDFPSSPKAPGAQLKLAYIKMKTSPDSTQELLDAFSQVRTKYASSPEAGVALVRIGYLHSRTDANQAVKDFEDFLAVYKDHPQCARVTRPWADYICAMWNWIKPRPLLIG